MTKWWRDLLNRLATRKPQNWVEASFILLNTSKEDQYKFEKALEKLKCSIRAGSVDKKRDLVVLSGMEKRKFHIVGYPPKDNVFLVHLP